MGKTCVICGKPSGFLPLCEKHMQMKANGEVVKCEDCGTWHIVGKPCKCKNKTYKELPTEGFYKCVACGAETNGYAFCYKCFNKYTEKEMLNILNARGKKKAPKKVEYIPFSTHTEKEPVKTVSSNKNNVITVDEENKSRCITCRKKTNGLLFCPQCFYKYKDKEIRVKITNCTDVELLSDDYEGRYTCKDGHIVKSKSERDIDNYLFEHGISHAYEKELSYGREINEVLHPDFFLPNYLGNGKDVYIEHWGFNENNFQYTQTKKFKMSIYKKSGITLVCTYEKTDSEKIDSVLDRKLNKKFIKENSINYEE